MCAPSPIQSDRVSMSLPHEQFSDTGLGPTQGRLRLIIFTLKRPLRGGQDVPLKSCLLRTLIVVCALVFPRPSLANFEQAPPPTALFVVVSIAPLSFLVSGVMAGAGQPHTLLPSGTTPHSYTMRPSDARALSQADLIFWGGEALETFLAHALNTLPKSAHVVELSRTPGLAMAFTTPARKFNEERGAPNMHFWLSTTNAQFLVDEIASALALRDPEHEALYKTNAAGMKQRLALLKEALNTQLRDVRRVPYMTYHDAYRYFEEEFDLNSQGALVANPDIPLGAASLMKLRRDTNRLSIACIFSEPQFEPQLIKILIKDAQIRTGTLDPLGTGIAPGPDGYFLLMQRLGEAFHRCLSH